MFEKAKIRFHDLKDAIKYEKDSVNDIKKSVSDIQESLNGINSLVNDLQGQLKKLDFKNKPHLERINEAQTRITESLANFPKKQK
ncbi:hypothetical protein FKV75_04190 [Weissella paramesenteroides]|jgi:peptidoglycan hydrolase CwlO-like protein|uniref:Uncharacterized protein n=2 Tax=Weissella paramesenteroides TaxID=1249 RepID=C5RBR3_WEIPA|nr:hypothetical protein [Weissella paramesenteroides]ATF41178.1 hypothetical protein CO680_03585 [Weissella paramesenteroides]EER74403.1 hypothetical protein HMPREF0877_1409 [Weissella paramesenteroides ATCC 33313]KAA8441033.1 hypothetical protein FKV81_05165 [Weissella paramesenteroides]KAA8441189.1 hypothetical protein FKV77_06790 [Weissella paramesenteroides]KAA8443465.1 hypothetical protein FKV75_04190 [Weissella paramesenteroides]